MPPAFTRCVASGGRVRTISHGRTYQHVCFSGGKSYAGEVHTKQGGMHKQTKRPKRH
jgi:hypothetical protein